MPALANPSRETSVFIRGELPSFWPLYLYRPTKTDGLHVSAFKTRQFEKREERRSPDLVNVTGIAN